jgi:DNA mismatch repair protein MutL
MGAIRRLSEQLINQIAAGEVIERPASVVKEMVENSIDAGADHVTIEIKKGGTEQIVITDNGSGMDETDARLAFERHATSKIASTADLFRIKSLGFRGEALASIAAVSKVVLQTKMESMIGGIRLEMEGGKEPIVTAAGCPVGTKLEVTNLFFNTPARKKYLKTEQTEYRHVLETVQDLALAHPEVGFKLVSNGRTVFDLSKTKELQARVGGLFGRSVSEEMLSVFYGGRDIQISGYVGKPHTARTTRKYQYFIVNGRTVSDHRLGYAIKEAYSNLIPSSQYPIFVVQITIDPEQVDVNVHPRKLEVRFADPREIFRVLKSSVQAALSREHMTQNVPIRDKNLDTPAFLRKEQIKATETKKVAVEETGKDYDPSMYEAPTLGFGSATSSGLGSSSSTGRSSMFGATSTAPRFGAGAETSLVSSTSSSAAPVANSIFGGSTPSSTTTGIATTSGEAKANLQARKAYLMKKRAERLKAQGKTDEAERLLASIETPAPPTAASPASTANPMFSSNPAPTSTATAPASPLFSPATSPAAPSTQDYQAERSHRSIEPLAQIRNSYIVAEDAEGIVIIDQHAAHERVMLDRFRHNENEREPAKQPLLAPLHLELDYREKAVLEENLDLLASLGFELSPFGGNTFTVDSIPDFMVKEDLEQVMKGFIDDLLNEQAPREAARRREHILHTLACRAAAKFGRRLSQREQQNLIQELLDTEGSCACAHGRPTMIRLSFNELEQKFGRKG